MTDTLPVFQGDGPEKVYFDFLKKGEFFIQRCGACHDHLFFPRVICTACGSSDLSWVKPSGRGSVYSTTVLRRKPQAGGDLNIALIDLQEGPRMMSRVEGIPATEVKIGLEVSADIVQDNGEPLLIFRPLGGVK